MMNIPVIKHTHDTAGNPELEIIVFQWSRKHGDCVECGLPAAYRSDGYVAYRGRASVSLDDRARIPIPTQESDPARYRPLCCVDAAQAAVDGERIERIEPDIY